LFTFQAFNNGNDTQVPGMAGTIRIWTQLAGANAAIPLTLADITAVDQDGNDAMAFVRLNWVGNRPQDGMVNIIDVRKPIDKSWQTIELTVKVFTQEVSITLINNRFDTEPPPPELGFQVFNNGTDAQVPGMAGMIRIWTRLDGVNAPVAFEGFTAVNQVGADVSRFVRINWVGNRPQDGMVNYIDVTKPADTSWEWMDLTVTANGQTVTITLHNNRWTPPPVLGLNAFNNGTDAQVPGMAGTIRIWTQLNKANAAIRLSAANVTAVDDEGNDAMAFIRINWVGNRPQDGMVNYFDVTKPLATADATWKTISLTIIAEEQVVKLELINNRNP